MDDPIAIGWIKENRHIGVKELIVRLNQKPRGYYGYYGITFKNRRLKSYYEQTKRKLHKWLKRRGGKQRWKWKKVIQLTTMDTVVKAENSSQLSISETVNRGIVCGKAARTGLLAIEEATIRSTWKW